MVLFVFQDPTKKWVFFSEFFSHQIRRERVNSSYTWIFHTWPPTRAGSLRLHQMSRSKDKKIVFVCAKRKSLQDVSNYSKKKHHDTTIMRRHTNINSWLAFLFILRFKTLKGSRVFNVIFFIHSFISSSDKIVTKPRRKIQEILLDCVYWDVI